MKVYLDSSVLLRYLLNADETLFRIEADHEIGSSELLEIECKRVLQRERLEMYLDDARYADSIAALESYLEMISILEIGYEVKRRASGSFPTVIGTLDAIHLSSALLWHESSDSEVAILTFDKQLALCAKAVGISSFES
jgi:predicted nucleic acid-binding protein